jgi:hypothetical protein
MAANMVEMLITPALSSSTIRVRRIDTIARTSLSPRILGVLVINVDPCDGDLLFVFGEEIFVDAFELDRPTYTHTDVVLRHKLCETLPVYQNHPLS